MPNLDLEKLNAMHKVLDTDPYNSFAINTIDKLYKKAIHSFATSDNLSKIVEDFRAATTGSDERKRFASSLFKESVHKIRGIRGLPNELPVNMNYPKSEVLEQRAPFIAPIAGRPYYTSSETQDKTFRPTWSYPTWVRNYSRSNGNPAYCHMTEEERRLLEEVVIGGKTVKYLHGEELEERGVFIKNGRFFDRNGKPFSTTSYRTRYHGEGYGTIVCRRGNLIYSYKHESKVLHHTSLSAGKAVIFAGEWQVEQGILKVLTNKTGHYRTPSGCFDYFIQYLREQQVSLNEKGIKYMS
ncbi:hypothetical protein [Photorhabdus sp. RW14-46]|uniref:hypothetical protein n=1 Tax=Photorhabdus sp. RW14-46 TaxID=2100168 RepID=UPI0013F3AE8B|nr:hypothetical protein [Photorhabdus sp. RW14-46]NHB63192.1 hypothetical protein [Photorhabdus sp. RW14-46]